MPINPCVGANPSHVRALVIPMRAGFAVPAGPHANRGAAPSLREKRNPCKEHGFRVVACGLDYFQQSQRIRMIRHTPPATNPTTANPAIIA